MTAEPLPAAVARLRGRAREDGGAAAFAHAAFTGADALAGWLRDCAGKLERREFVLPSMEDDPDTLYLWLNDVTFELDRWFLAAFAYAWAGRSETVGVSELFDGVVGHEAADLEIDLFTLAGPEALQSSIAAGQVDHEPAGQLVTVLAMELVDRALATSGDLGVRVALSRSDEPLICLWERDGDAWVSSVHAEDGVWT